MSSTAHIGAALLANVERSLTMANMPELWVVVLVVVPLVVFAVTALYRREKGRLTPWTRGALTAVRVTLILLVLFLLFQPVVETTVYQVRRPTLAVLIDESASMQRSDRYADETTRHEVASLAGVSEQALAETPRLDLVKAVLAGSDDPRLERLAGENDLRVYAFSSDVREIGSERVTELRPRGDATALGDAVHTVLRQLRGQPVSGIVVLSDGRSNAGRAVEDAAEDAQNRPAPVPVFTVGVGDPDEPRDVGIEEIASPEIALAGDEIIFEVTVRSKGFPGQRVEVLLREEGEQLASASLVLEGKNREQKVLLYHRPLEEGTHRFEVHVPVLPDEEYVENNTVVRDIDVIRRHIKVLFADGYPRWEYRYLKEALRRDDEAMKMSCLLLSADPDFVQESSRGVAPLAQFPRTREEIFEYDVILFGDVNPQDLAREGVDVDRVLEMIRDFVEEGSGGFGMIAGENDAPRSYRNSPIESLLPVVIGDDVESDPSFGSDPRVSHQLRLTDVGMADPIMILEQDPDENRRRWEHPDYGLPGFFWYYPVKKPKAGARVLAVHPTHENKYGRLPLVATQFYGSGRTFFSALDSSWRWRFLHGDLYFYRFWSQVIRFLAAARLNQFNPRFEIFCDKSRYVLGERVIITAKVRDKNFEPAQGPTQTVILQEPDSAEPIELTLKADPTKPGTYTHTLVADEVGTYRVRAPEQWRDDDRERTVSFSVTIPSAEKENVSLDAGTLAVLARRTDGEYLPLARIERLADAIVPLPERVAGNRTREDLWDREWRLGGIPLSWAILLFMLLIVTEWMLRKRMRLL